VNGGRGRCEKSPRAKSAREMKRDGEKGRRVWGQARNLRTTGNRRRRPDRFSLSLFLPSFFFFPGPSCPSWQCALPFFLARISCDVGRAAVSWRNRGAETISLAPPSVSSSGCREGMTRTFFRISAIFYATSLAQRTGAQIDINTAYA